jgi:HK97 gp10 family phage protein
MFGLNLEGDVSLRQLLQELGPEIEEKVTVDAMRKAAVPIVEATRANAMRLGTRSVQRAATVMAASLERKVQRLAKRGKTGKAKALVQKTIAKWYLGAMEGNLQHQLAASIGSRQKRYTAQGVVYVAIGPRWPEGAHGHLVEMGHRTTVRGTGTLRRISRGGKPRRDPISKLRGRTGRGRVRSFVPAHPFLRPAFDAHKDEAFSVAVQEHRARVERVAQQASYHARAGKIGATWTQIAAGEAAG